MANLPTPPQPENFSYWRITCVVDGKAYKQLMADSVAHTNAYKIFEVLKKLGATKCAISFHTATEAEFDLLFVPTYEH